jgi:hypothetical protein
MLHMRSKPKRGRRKFNAFVSSPIEADSCLRGGYARIPKVKKPATTATTTTTTTTTNKLQ